MTPPILLPQHRELFYLRENQVLHFDIPPASSVEKDGAGPAAGAG